MPGKTLLAAAVLAAAGFGPLLADQAAAATTSRTCAVDNIAVIDARMHIKCAPNPQQAYTGEIRHYAMPLNEPPAKIQGILALAIEAKRISKPMVIWFDMDDYQSVPGCLGRDCRRLKGAALE